MANDDKVENKIDEAAGKVKETAGRVTGDEETRREGEFDKDKAHLKDKVQDAVEAAKDVFKK
ncbi:MAG: CsbD family protein [Pseudonocardiaceae bacterium]